MRTPTGHPFVAALLDTVMAPLDKLRGEVVPPVAGRVLEVGSGTGLNARHYDPARVEAVQAVEPDPHMRRRAAPRVAAAAVPVTLHDAPGERLPFDDASFDAVVFTWSLCTIPDPAAALAEAWRVLKPGGTLHFAEHVRSSRPLVAAAQAGLNPLWTRLAGGCHLDRDTVAHIAAAGFEVGPLARDQRASWAPVPNVTGTARKPQG